jgi:hypothetical protein
MSKVFAINLEHVKHQHVLEHAQMQNEQQVQLTLEKKSFFKPKSFQLNVVSNYIPTTKF